MKRVLFILLIWIMLSASVPLKEARAAEPSFLPGSAIIYIDPLRNRLSLVVDGVIYKKYPVALGKLKTPTPVGEWKIVNKYENWGSGFGTRWMGLNVPWGIYGIHGTSEPSSIGSDASHGCIRMYNRHVEELFRLVPLGTPVHILGHALGEPYVEPRTLAAGDTGADVMLIQYRLRSAGYYNGVCNGKFGTATQRALEQYERDHGLPRDGVFGLHDYRSLGLIE